MAAKALGFVREVGQEVVFIGAFLGLMWFASYLYEFGFLARFGVPVTLADVGFSKTLTVLLFVGPAAGFIGGFVMILAGLIDGDLRGPFLAFVAASAVVLVGLGLTMEGWAGSFITDNGPDILPRWLAVALTGCVLFYAGRVGDRALRSLRAGGTLQVCQSSLLVLLLLLVPVGFGWLGGGQKAHSSNTFLYLADDDEYVLVRIYDQQAVFVQYDREQGTFRKDYLVRRLGEEFEAQVTFRPTQPPASGS